MRSMPVLVIAALLVGCGTPTRPPVVTSDGFVHYTGSGTFDCAGRPVSFDGYHNDVRLRGPCTNVRIVGGHNDIDVAVAPGGTIQLVGSHNDVTWRLTQAGPAPNLSDQGVGNTFHHELGDGTY
jgi:hypothetical protein